MFFILFVCSYTALSQYEWEEQNSGASATLNSIKFYDTNFGFCVGEGGQVLKTQNGGQDWVTIATLPELNGNPLTNFLVAVEIYDSNNIVIFSKGGQVYKSTDGGVNFEKVGFRKVSFSRCFDHFSKATRPDSKTRYCRCGNNSSNPRKGLQIRIIFVWHYRLF